MENSNSLAVVELQKLHNVVVKCLFIERNFLNEDIINSFSSLRCIFESALNI